LATLNVDVITSVPPLRSTTAVTECEPLLRRFVLNGLALLPAVPARSQGAMFSVL